MASRSDVRRVDRPSHHAARPGACRLRCLPACGSRHVGPEAGAWSTWMMAATALNWIIMVMLDIVFMYLVVLSLYNRHLCMPAFTLTPEAAHGSSQGSRLRNDG